MIPEFIPAACLFSVQQKGASSHQNPWGSLRVDCSPAPPPGQRVKVQQTRTGRVRWCCSSSADFDVSQWEVIIKRSWFVDFIPWLVISSGASNPGITIENEAWSQAELEVAPWTQWSKFTVIWKCSNVITKDKYFFQVRQALLCVSASLNVTWRRQHQYLWFVMLRSVYMTETTSPSTTVKKKKIKKHHHHHFDWSWQSTLSAAILKYLGFRTKWLKLICIPTSQVSLFGHEKAQSSSGRGRLDSFLFILCCRRSISARFYVTV